MTEVNIDAYLSVTSLGLLGYNTDEYKQLYPGIAMELPPIKLSTFDKESESSLLCCLHFLLSRLDYDEFTYSIQDCWPYLCSKSKSDFKHATVSCLRKLQMQGTVNVFERISPQFWGSHLTVKGPEVWLLLRILSDMCVEFAIKALSPPSTSTVTCSDVPIMCSLSPALDRDSPAIAEPGSEGSKKQRRKSIVQQQSEEFHSISHKETFDNGRSPDNANMDRASLLAYIVEMQHQVEEMIVSNIAKQNRQQAYLEELDQRLKTARTQLDNSQRRAQKSIKQGGVFALSESGRKTRVAKLEKISASLRLIEHLSEASLLGAAMMLVVEDKEMLAHSTETHHDHFPLPEETLDTDKQRTFVEKMDRGQQQLASAATAMNMAHAVSELVAILDSVSGSCS